MTTDTDREAFEEWIRQFKFGNPPVDYAIWQSARAPLLEEIEKLKAAVQFPPLNSDLAQSLDAAQSDLKLAVEALEHYAGDWFINLHGRQVNGMAATEALSRLSAYSGKTEKVKP